MRVAAIALFLAAAASAEDIHKRPNFVPDPASVERCGKGYRYPQCGWIVVHVEGAPYERGYQYGKLLAGEIAGFLDTLGRYYSAKDPEAGYRNLRSAAQALFLPKYDLEWREEMKGIADGAADAGAKLNGKAIDLLDIVALNSEVEFDFLDNALRRTPTGLEGKRFEKPANAAPPKPDREHCSAFIATAPATADGKIVFGHITMWNLEQARFFNVWLDVAPAKGQRCAFQTIPGGIMSGMDYYFNAAGIVLSETTIAQTPFQPDGLALASRCRSAIQYGTSIDDVVKFLSERNNGLYTNEWLLGDTKTNEIAMFEMGTRKQKLWRSGRGEWPGGTAGFYWGCNNAKDAGVRLDAADDPAERPRADPTFRPSGRDLEWLGLYAGRKGTINEAFGFESFTAPRLACRGSLDAKFATADQVKAMSTWAVFGPPRGGVWKHSERKPSAPPLRPNDWTVLAPANPPPASGNAAVDLGPSWSRPRDAEPGDDAKPAWKGTILPASDADVWLAAGWAKAEALAALENSLAGDRKKPLAMPAARRLARAQYALSAQRFAASQRLGAFPAPAEYRHDFRGQALHDFTVARGAEFLLHLRGVVGPKAFDEAAHAFGQAHAGKPVTTAMFQAALEAAAKKPLAAEFDRWLRPGPAPGAMPSRQHFWAVGSFHQELERTVIVYGTAGDVVAQREAAAALVEKLREDLDAAAPKAIPDTAADDAALAGKHVIVLGRPATNRLAARWADRLTVRFGSGSFEAAGKKYANEDSAILFAQRNPLDARKSLVVAAGLGVNATARAAEALLGSGDRSVEALLLEAGQAPRPLLLRNPEE